MSNVLTVAAHPDDEILGCGATMARLSKTHGVRILILGEGETSRGEGRSAEVAALRGCAQEAAAAVGAKGVELESFADNRFDTVALLDLVKSVEDRIERYRPEIVFTHHPGDVNVDHRRTFEAVLAATRPIQGGSVRELLCFEIASSTEWAFQRLAPAFRPNVFYDVAADFAAKKMALDAYPGEMRKFPHPRSLKNVEAMARSRGASVGFELAEAFESIRTLRR